MRRIIVFLLLTVSILVTIPVIAQDRQLSQTHSIEIEVECLDLAMEVIRELNGYNLESAVRSYDFGRWGVERRADFTRRVDMWAFRHVQEVLRSLGEVLQESERAQFLGGQILDVDARLATLEQEIQRLTAMLAASESLDVMIAIEIRLSQVTWERNQLMGRRNVLLSQAASPVITIRLVQRPEYMPPPEGPGFGSRIVDNFLGSWHSFVTSAGNFLVFIVRVSIPFVALCALFIPLTFGALYVLKRRREQDAGRVARMAVEAFFKEGDEE